MILLNPGPVNVSPRVTAALARGDICHREPEMNELLTRVRHRLVEAFAPRSRFGAVLVTGSGTAALETAVTSVLSATGRLLVVSWCTTAIASTSGASASLARRATSGGDVHAVSMTVCGSRAAAAIAAMRSP